MDSDPLQFEYSLRDAQNSLNNSQTLTLIGCYVCDVRAFRGDFVLGEGSQSQRGLRGSEAYHNQV